MKTNEYLTAIKALVARAWGMDYDFEMTLEFVLDNINLKGTLSDTIELRDYIKTSLQLWDHDYCLHAHLSGWLTGGLIRDDTEIMLSDGLDAIPYTIEAIADWENPQ